MGAHARLSPSGAHKWKPCVAAPALEDGCPDSSSKFADEGTALHELAAMAAVAKKRAEAYIGRKIVAGKNTFVVDEAMAEAVQFYLDYITELSDRFSDPDVFIETWLPGSPLFCFPKTGNPDEPDEGSGTADFALLGLSARNNPERPSVIHIVDFKGGRGVQVYASENEQGLMYLVNGMSVWDMFDDVEEFHFHIVQPRVQGGWVDSAQYTRAEILEFAGEAAAKGNEALELVKQKQNLFGPAPLNPLDVVPATEPHAEFIDRLVTLANPSEDACRWCKAKARCPALEREVIETVFNDFDTWEAVTEETVKALPALTETLNAKLNKMGLIEDYVTAIRAEGERQLFEGVGFRDWKLVEGRRGPRAWKDKAIAEKVMKDMRLKSTEMYDFKVRTPPALESHVAKKYPRKWQKLLPLIVQTDGKPSVAPMHDKRPAWAPVTASDFHPTDSSDLF